MKEDKKIGFFKSIFYSITNIEKYPEMSAQGLQKAIGYLVKLMLIFAVIVSIGLMYQFHGMVNNVANYIQEEMPNIEYQSGKLTVDSTDPIIINGASAVLNNVIIDTNTDSEEKISEYLSSFSEGSSGVIILNNKIILKTSVATMASEYLYTDLLTSIFNEDIESFNKQDLVNYLTGSSINNVYFSFFFVMWIYTFILYFLSVLTDTLVLAILGNLTTLIAKMRVKFVAVYNMAVYALTLSILLNAVYITVNMITGFEIKYFQVMYTSIAYIYLVATIFIIKSDFNKQQGELMRIVEEQKKIREEMNEKEQEEQNKEEDKKEDEEEKKEKTKEDKGDNEPGELNGSGA